MDPIISFREDPEIIAQIDALAEKRGTDRSAIVREAIREFLVKWKEAKK